MLIPRISYECRWGLTGFYPTKELCFDVTTAMTGVLLKHINTVWLGVSVSSDSFEEY